jgi:RNA polymerase sigma factor (sigma-70 family)
MCAKPNQEVLSRSENIFNEEYLQRLRDHDPLTEAHFYCQFRSRLKVKLGGRGLQDSDIRDIIQETFMRTLNAVHEHKIESPQALGGYVSGVCDNILYEKYNDRARSHVNVDAVDIPDEGEELEDRVYREERRKLVEMVLQDLRSKDRELLRARIIDQLSYDEMCVRFKVSANNIRVLLHRATKKFADACRKREWDFDKS